MKRQYCTFVLLLAGGMLLLQAGCQGPAKSPGEPAVTTTKDGKKPPKVGTAPKPGEPAPKIAFESMVCDFGEVGPNKDNTNDIKFTNTGDALLKISKVDRCCGVVTKLDTMEYAPGESGTLQVQWKSGPLPSKFTRQLVVHSNDPVNPDISVTITATVVQRVLGEPSRLKLFLDEENGGCPEITLRSLDDRPFSITGFNSTADCITADFDPSVEATKFVLQPKVDQEKLQKNLKGRVNIELTHPEGNSVSILFDVLPQYTVSPPLIIIFDAQPETPTVREIKVLNNYRKDFEIESLASKSGLVGVKLLEQQKISNGYVLKVEITPPAAGEKIRFSETFNLNLKGGAKLSVTCNGYFAKKKPSLPTP
ncbi:MAG TPA: DUF1573 domain-containing protein [Sedimentisphaerales bacterium]|nr:DUF1573 domain-containing protein [Sedimentisphaerales bacterium]